MRTERVRTISFGTPVYCEGNIPPVVIEVLLHVYCREPLRDTPANNLAVAFLLREHMIMWENDNRSLDDCPLVLTLKGQAHVKALMTLRFPTNAYDGPGDGNAPIIP